MWLNTSCNLTFEITEPTTFLLMLRPRSNKKQWIARDEYITYPAIKVIEYSDSFGNLCQRLIAPPGNFSIRTSSIVMTDENIETCPGAPFSEIQTLPSKVIPYLLPSRYCESDRLGALASDIVGDIESGYDQVCRIVEWVKNTLRYIPGSSYCPMSALELENQDFGVCRDLTHLSIALCRGLSIPARITVGYLYKLEPMDLHAWFEAYVGGKWYTFDPTLDEPRGGRVVVAHGRDAADVAIFNQFGPPVQLSHQEVKVNIVDNFSF